MHDIKFIKDNSSIFDEILKKRNISSSSKEILLLHQDYLDNLKKTQGLQEKKKFIVQNVFFEIKSKRIRKNKK